MTAIKRFVIFKNFDAVDPQPGYRMVAKDEAGKELKLGSVWIKEHTGKEGKVTKYYSGQMKDEFVKEDGSKFEGYVIITQTEYDALKAGVTQEVKGDVIDPEEVPF